MNFFENDTSDPILDMSFGILLARGKMNDLYIFIEILFILIQNLLF